MGNRTELGIAIRTCVIHQ